MKRLLLLVLLIGSLCNAQTVSMVEQYRVPNEKPPVGFRPNWAHPASDGLTGEWLFNEGVGGSVQDGSGHFDNLSIINATWQPGFRGPSLSFDGDGDYIQVTANASNIISPVGGAFKLWFNARTQGTGDTGYIIGHRISGQDNRIYILVDDISNDLFFGFGDNFHAIGSNNNVENDGLWHHAVITWDATTAYGYLDGNLVGSYAYTLLNTAGEIAIGDLGHDKGFEYTGQVDTVSINNRTLSSNEIQADYLDGFARYTPPPLWSIIESPATSTGQVIFMN